MLPIYRAFGTITFYLILRKRAKIHHTQLNEQYSCEIKHVKIHVVPFVCLDVLGFSFVLFCLLLSFFDSDVGSVDLTIREYILQLLT